MANSTSVLLYTDDHAIGGVAQYNHALLCGLAQRGYRITCAQSPLDNPLIRHQSDRGVRHVWLDFPAQKDFARTLTNTDAGLDRLQ
jgi:hypothetical protein